jgi:hypothetical protein
VRFNAATWYSKTSEGIASANEKNIGILRYLGTLPGVPTEAIPEIGASGYEILIATASPLNVPRTPQAHSYQRKHISFPSAHELPTIYSTPYKSISFIIP